MQPMGVYVASTGEAQMLPRCVMPAGQAIVQLNCVDWIVKAIHLFILFQGNWTDEHGHALHVPLLWPAA